MVDFDPEFELITKRKNARHEREVYDAYHHTLAGLETGYLLKTFLKKAKLEAKQFEQLYRQMLSDLLRDPKYAKLYNDTKALVDRAQKLTEDALERIKSELSDAQDTLNKTLENANKLPDGTEVFMDAKGNYVTKNGRLLTAQEQEILVWRETSVSYEDYVAQKDAIDLLEKREQELVDYQNNVLGRISNRLSNEKEPPRKDEYKSFQDDINNGLQKLIKTKDNEHQISDQTHNSGAVKIFKP